MIHRLDKYVIIIHMNDSRYHRRHVTVIVIRVFAVVVVMVDVAMGVPRGGGGKIRP